MELISWLNISGLISLEFYMARAMSKSSRNLADGEYMPTFAVTENTIKPHL